MHLSISNNIFVTQDGKTGGTVRESQHVYFSLGVLARLVNRYTIPIYQSSLSLETCFSHALRARGDMQELFSGQPTICCTNTELSPTISCSVKPVLLPTTTPYNIAASWLGIVVSLNHLVHVVFGTDRCIAATPCTASVLVYRVSIHRISTNPLLAVNTTPCGTPSRSCGWPYGELAIGLVDLWPIAWLVVFSPLQP